MLVAGHGAVEKEVLIVEGILALLVRDDGAWEIGLSVFVHTFCINVREVFGWVVGRVQRRCVASRMLVFVCFRAEVGKDLVVVRIERAGHVTTAPDHMSLADAIFTGDVW